jgi:hypothetical protein
VAKSPELLELGQRHRAAQDRIGQAVGERLRTALANLPLDYTPETNPVAAYAEVALPTIRGGQRASISVAASYMQTAGALRAAARGRSSGDHTPELERAYQAAKIADDSASTTAPAVRLLALAAQGRDDARDVAGTYAGLLASRDLQGAQQAGLDAGADAAGERPIGWAKELNPGACDWCVLVGAERVYSDPDSVPIHGVGGIDQCSYAPVYEGEAHAGRAGMILNEAQQPDRLEEVLAPEPAPAPEPGQPGWEDRRDEILDLDHDVREQLELAGGGWRELGADPRPPVPPAYLEGIEQYKSSSWFLNNALRAGTDLEALSRGEWSGSVPFTPAGQPAAIAEGDARRALSTINALEHEMRPLEHDAILYRGVERAGLLRGDVLSAADFEAGDLIEDKGFMSTSLSGDTAEGWARGEKSVVLNILAPKGTPAFDFTRQAADLEAGYDESELVLDRGTKLMVTGPAERDPKGPGWNLPVMAMAA